METFHASGICEMLSKYSRLAWRRYLIDRTNVKAAASLVEQNALTNPARPIVSVEAVDAVEPEACSPSIPAMASNEND